MAEEEGSLSPPGVAPHLPPPSLLLLPGGRSPAGGGCPRSPPCARCRHHGVPWAWEGPQRGCQRQRLVAAPVAQQAQHQQSRATPTTGHPAARGRTETPQEEKIQMFDLTCSEHLYRPSLRLSSGAVGGHKKKSSGIHILSKEMAIHPSGSKESLRGMECSASWSSDIESGSESECSKDLVVCNAGVAPPAAAAASALRHRDPLAILMKVFPLYTQSRLERILLSSRGDIVQAIEHILNLNEQKQEEQVEQSVPPLPKYNTSQLFSDFSLFDVDITGVGGKSAFTPLYTNPASFRRGVNFYHLRSQLGIQPLRVTYTPLRRPGPRLMLPYLRTGLFPLLPFHPAIDHSFSEMINNTPCFPNKGVVSSKAYTRQSEQNNCHLK